MRRVGLEPTRPKAATGSLVLRVCQFRHPRLTQDLVYHAGAALVNTFLPFFEPFYKKRPERDFGPLLALVLRSLNLVGCNNERCPDTEGYKDVKEGNKTSHDISSGC